MKIIDVIDRIIAYHPSFPADYNGCDGFKCGDPQAECTGIAVALVPTVDVIRRAATAGCNLLVVHEPTFFTSLDAAEGSQPFFSAVQEKKAALLKEYGITVWRDHDRMHAHQPDSIFTGVIRYLGWEDYRLAPEQQPVPMGYAFRLPKTTVGDLAAYLMKKLDMNGIRFVGKKDAVVENVAIVGHLFPGFGDDDKEEYGQKIIHAMDLGVDVIIPGEIIEWTALSYVRDAVALGKTKAVMNIGHFNMEELGMRFAADWVSELVEHALPVKYLPTKDLYNYMLNAERM